MDVKSLNFSTASGVGDDLELRHVAQSIVESGCAPAVAISVSRRRSDGWTRASVAAGVVGMGFASPQTPFDLASVTKPFVALAAADLAGRSVIRLADPVEKWLPELQDSGLADCSIERLLAHRTGLPGHRILFNRLVEHRAVRKSEMLARAAKSLQSKFCRSGVKCGAPATYSDLGYMVLGAIIERATGQELDTAVEETVTKRLSVDVASSRQWRRRFPDFQQVVAPTETVAWRGGPLRGAVHDENAWALAGYGVAGHAGLFGTSTAVARLGEAMIDAVSARPSPISRFAALVVTGLREGGTLRAGFDGISTGRSSAGTRISRHAFGHLGYTGTSLWCDPIEELVFVVLSNRVCPSRGNTRLPQARPKIHDCLFEWATRKERLT